MNTVKSDMLNLQFVYYLNFEIIEVQKNSNTFFNI